MVVCSEIKTKKSDDVAQSTTEAEYFAMAEAAKEIAYERKLLESLGFTQSQPTVLHGDNEAALKLAVEKEHLNSHDHIHTRYHISKNVFNWFYFITICKH